MPVGFWIIFWIAIGSSYFFVSSAIIIALKLLHRKHYVKRGLLYGLAYFLMLITLRFCQQHFPDERFE